MIVFANSVNQNSGDVPAKVSQVSDKAWNGKG